MLNTHGHLDLSLKESVTHRNAMGDGWVWGASGLMFYDFSTGYPSLSYLQRLPTQVVKIDSPSCVTCSPTRVITRWR